MNNNPNNNIGRAGRPRLENTPLREYWRKQKQKQKGNYK